MSDYYDQYAEARDQLQALRELLAFCTGYYGKDGAVPVSVVGRLWRSTDPRTLAAEITRGDQGLEAFRRWAGGES